MAGRTTNKNKSFKGSNVYLTYAEKDALKRAIHQYYEDIECAEDKAFLDFFKEYDEQPLASAYKKLVGRNKN